MFTIYRENQRVTYFRISNISHRDIRRMFSRSSALFEIDTNDAEMEGTRIHNTLHMLLQAQ